MVNDYFGYSAGAFAVAWEMSHELLARGHQVFFLCATEDPAEEGFEEIEGRPVARIFIKTHLRARPLVTINRIGVVKKAMAWVTKFKPDIIHGHVLHLHLSFGLPAAADKAGYPVVLTAHDTGIFCPTKYVCQPPEDPNYPSTINDCAKCLRFRYLPGRATITTRMVNRHVKAVASVSEALAGIIRANGVKNVEVINNGLNPAKFDGVGLSGDEFKAKSGLGPEPLILYGGRLQRDKGDEEALRGLAATTPALGAKLVIAGQKELFGDRLKKLAAELGITDRIVLAGWLDRAEMLGAFRAAGAVLVPSIYPDPFPTVNLEAMSLSRPVVGTMFGGTPEMVVDGETGFIVDPRDSEAVGQALTRLLADQDPAARMGAAGRKRVEEKLNLALQCDRFEELYGRFIPNNP